MGQKLKDVSEYILSAIENIEKDRAITSTLLTDIMVKLKQASEDSHQDLGLIAAKYVETLQRSNEQLVKITGLLHKKDSKEQLTNLSSKDKDELFDLIQENK